MDRAEVATACAQEASALVHFAARALDRPVEQVFPLGAHFPQSEPVSMAVTVRRLPARWLVLQARRAVSVVVAVAATAVGSADREGERSGQMKT
jgi:hypothetical protein